MADLPRRIALVYDRVNKWGGAEQVLLNLHELFPEAPLYTAVYNSATAPWAQVFPDVIPSFLQQLPGAKSHHELFPWLTPLAFESLDLTNFDIVISVTSADAKGVITRPDTLHVCYCLTPTRYLWSHEQFYKSQLTKTANLMSKPVFEYLKKWDQIASTRPDTYLAISKTVQDRISRYYHRQSTIIYPPVDVNFYAQPQPPPALENFFLYVGRLVAYKRAQLLVETFNDLQLPLAIIGAGALERKLRAIANSNIYFFNNLTNSELIPYYQHAQALLFMHEEDFGIIPVEAMASGTPVIGLNKGGVAETVVHETTGLLITDAELKPALLNFDRSKFDATVIRQHAGKFSKNIFKQNFLQELTHEWQTFRNTSTY